MKNFLSASDLITLCLGLITIFNSCKKDKTPTLTTSEVTNITGTTATSGGEILDEGSGGITSKGVCWAFITEPTPEWYETNDGTGTGSFMSNITGLYGGHTYYVRAYATNSAGTSYGTAQSFKTLGQAPVAITKPATNITATDATLNGTVNPNDLSTDLSFQYGNTTDYGQTISATQSPCNGNIDTDVSADLSGLEGGKTYHFRIMAINYLGTTLGEDLTFITP